MKKFLKTLTARILFITGMLILASHPVDAGELALAVDGKSDSLIQLSPQAEGPEFEAALELQNYIRKISGAELKRSTYPATFFRSTENPGLTEILLCTLRNGSQLMTPEIRKKLESAASDQAYYLKTDGKRLIIAGKSAIGVLYGTYTFLEDYLNVHWYHPGETGEVYTRRPTLTIPVIDRFETPDIQQRIVATWAEAAKPWTMAEATKWMQRNKLQHHSMFHYPDRSRVELDDYACNYLPPNGGGHLTFEQCVPQKLFQTNPELFPLKDGKRICQDRSQRCMSNPVVQKMVTDYVVDFTRYGAVFAIDYHDSTDGWCACTECVEMGTAGGKFSYSNLAHRFSSIVAEEVYKLNPEAKLMVSMYSQFRPLPTAGDIKYDQRILALYCPHQRCYVHALNDRNSDCNLHFFNELTEWRKLYPKAGLFEYYCTARSPYAPFEYTFAQDARYYAGIKLERWEEDASATDAFYLECNWPFYYAAAKLLWNSSLDIDKLMNDAYTQYYGPAAEPMLKYQQLRRELWESAPGHALYGGPFRIGHCLTVPGAEKRLTDLLVQAKGLAAGAPVFLQRIAMDENNLKKYWVAEAEKLKKIMTDQKDIPTSERRGEIQIDGRLDEAAWRSAPLVTGFKGENGTEPEEETRVKVLYDQDFWYIGIEAMTEKAWTKLKADAKERDGAVWNDDSVEVFIAPPGSNYYHWIVNSIGTFYDARMRDANFDSGAEIKTTVEKNRYTVEMKIPAERLGSKIQPGQTWQFHFFRSMTNLQPPKATASSSLDGAEPHQQTHFRRAAIGQSVIQNSSFSSIIDNKNPNIKGAKFPQFWEGSQAELAGNKIKISGSGYIMQWMQLNMTPDKKTMNGEIKVQGNGELNIWLSTCSRPPENQQPFGHEIRRELLNKVQLDGQPQIFNFSSEIGVYEMGYIFVQLSEGTIEYINATLTR